MPTISRACTPAASCRSTRRPGRSRRTCSGKLVRQALDELPADNPGRAAGRPARAPRSWCRGGRRSRRRTFRRTRSSVERLNAFRTPAQRRLIFEEFFLFQIGHAWRRHATSAELKPFVPKVDDRIRASAAKILPFKLTPGQRQARQGDRRRHAAAAADAPPAAGRRRRRQDDRRAAGRDRGDGERPAGGVHGADRDPRRAALRQHRAAAVAVALPRRPADRQHAGPAQAHAAGAHRARHDAT